MFNRGDMYSVDASAGHHVDGSDIALGQVHLRQEIKVVEGERWAPV